MIHKIWHFCMVIQALSRSRWTWWISWSEEEVLRHQRRPTCRTPNPSFLKSTFFSLSSFLTEYPQNLKTKKSRTTARESSAEKGSESSSDASCPVDDRGHRCKRFTRALSVSAVAMKLGLQSKRVSNCCKRFARPLSAVALSTWNFSCSLKEFQTVAGALLEPFL